MGIDKARMGCKSAIRWQLGCPARGIAQLRQGVGRARKRAGSAGFSRRPRPDTRTLTARIIAHPQPWRAGSAESPAVAPQVAASTKALWRAQICRPAYQLPIGRLGLRLAWYCCPTCRRRLTRRGTTGSHTQISRAAERSRALDHPLPYALDVDAVHAGHVAVPTRVLGKHGLTPDAIAIAVAIYGLGLLAFVCKNFCNHCIMPRRHPAPAFLTLLWWRWWWNLVVAVGPQPVSAGCPCHVADDTGQRVVDVWLLAYGASGFGLGRKLRRAVP